VVIAAIVVLALGASRARPPPACAPRSLL